MRDYLQEGDLISVSFCCSHSHKSQGHGKNRESLAGGESYAGVALGSLRDSVSLSGTNRQRSSQYFLMVLYHCTPGASSTER